MGLSMVENQADQKVTRGRIHSKSLRIGADGKISTVEDEDENPLDKLSQYEKDTLKNMFK